MWLLASPTSAGAQRRVGLARRPRMAPTDQTQRAMPAWPPTVPRDPHRSGVRLPGVADKGARAQSNVAVAAATVRRVRAARACARARAC
eukprot:2675546-Pleurochrysis_carterae.AAC.1